MIVFHKYHYTRYVLILTEPWDVVATCVHGACGAEECSACQRELDTILATCGTYLDT